MTEKFCIACVIKNCIVLLRNFVNKLNKIQFNNFYINMWLSSLHFLEENQFYEIKKRNI